MQLDTNKYLFSLEDTTDFQNVDTLLSDVDIEAQKEIGKILEDVETDDKKVKDTFETWKQKRKEREELGPVGTFLKDLMPGIKPEILLVAVVFVCILLVLVFLAISFCVIHYSRRIAQYGRDNRGGVTNLQINQV